MHHALNEQILPSFGYMLRGGKLSMRTAWHWLYKLGWQRTELKKGVYIQCLKKLIKCFALSQCCSYISRNNKVKVMYLGLYKLHQIKGLVPAAHTCACFNTLQIWLY